jgi:phosphoglucomutase
MVRVRVESSPFEGQKPGTSGLRKKTTVFQQEHYVENFVQCSLEAAGLEALAGKTLVVGGDGRFYNDVMVQKIVKICAANGVGKVVTGQNGLLSTPAVSALIRHIKAEGGFILTASHNPEVRKMTAASSTTFRTAARPRRRSPMTYSPRPRQLASTLPRTSRTSTWAPSGQPR